MIFSFFEGKKRAICNKEDLKCLGIDYILYSHKLLRKSIFLSFPPATKMFQFTGLLLHSYVFTM